jgi:hypothetical protein
VAPTSFDAQRGHEVPMASFFSLDWFGLVQKGEINRGAAAF